MCASLSHSHYWYEVGMLKVSDSTVSVVPATTVPLFGLVVISSGFSSRPTFVGIIFIA